jgi:hypothetical protein
MTNSRPLAPGILLVCAALLASCDMGTRDLCCGYETSEDWTSDVSIVKDGLVMFAYVSAIVEQENGYVIICSHRQADRCSFLFGARGASTRPQQGFVQR